ncbi:MAG: H-type lectin domain-containing protein [FCB group bacterium]|nr:H-type lectin domain-containing protein [FCB group bacterium]
MNDKPKSVLDILARCEDMENRLQQMEKQKIQSVETGYVSIVKDPVLTREGKGNKIVKKTIIFDVPFKEVPEFFPSITAFNLDRSHEARLEVLVEDVSRESAEITVRTWRESQAYYARIEWLAIGVK